MENNYKFYIEYDGNNPVLSWEAYPDSLSYNIYRGSEANMTLVANTKILFWKDLDVNIYEDTDYADWVYKISSVNADGEVFFTSTESTSYKILKYPLAGVLNRIIQLNMISLERIIGEPGYFYIKLGAGERCTECYDFENRDVRTDLPMCMTCYNTSYTGGYEKIAGYIKLRNASESILEGIYGKVVDKTVVAWTLPYPILNTGDFFRTTSGEIYIINDVNRKKQNGKGTIQMLNCKLLETGRPEYLIL